MFGLAFFGLAVILFIGWLVIPRASMIVLFGIVASTQGWWNYKIPPGDNLSITIMLLLCLFGMVGLVLDFNEHANTLR